MVIFKPRHIQSALDQMTPAIGVIGLVIFHIPQA